MSESPTHIVEFDDVVKDYTVGLLGRRTLRALDHCSLTIRTGEIFGLLGPNRAGKTTLAKLLLSLCRPTAGKLRRFGQPISDKSTLGRIGYVHDNQAFPRYLTAAGLLEYYGALGLVPSDILRKRVPRLLELVGLADRSRESISRFSKGMVQRLGLAQALINDPDLLVLDEPNEGLDLAGRQMVNDLLRERRQQGRSTLLISHILSEVEQLCDRVAVLISGRVAYDGPLADLQTKAGESRSLTAALQELYRQAGSRN